MGVGPAQRGRVQRGRSRVRCEPREDREAERCEAIVAVPDLRALAVSAVADFAAELAKKGGKLDLGTVEIEVLPKPHRPTDIPSGRMAVYCFFLGERPLKVGIAGPNSNARYRSQHYNPGSAGSTLAGSLIRHPDKVGVPMLEPDEVGTWIKSNTDRVNILVPVSFGRGLLPFLERFLHERWKPVYEGLM